MKGFWIMEHSDLSVIETDFLQFMEIFFPILCTFSVYIILCYKSTKS